MKLFEFKRGITREVFLIGGIAIKFPSVRNYPLFLRGILCNIQEREFSKNLKSASDKMCPVWFKFPLGLFIIMPKCEPSGLDGYEDVSKIIQPYRDAGIPVECKPCSFGWYKNKLVAVDYGS